MPSQRFLRGLLGAALTWGVVGAAVGAAMFFGRYQPWTLPLESWGRGFRLLGMFMGTGAAWGAACGLAFGLVVRAAAKHARFEELSAWRFVAWGALAGAAFPGLLYGAFVLRTGLYGAIPLYSTLTGISALLGAGLGRVILAVARRAPQDAIAAAELTDGTAAQQKSPTTQTAASVI